MIINFLIVGFVSGIIFLKTLSSVSCFKNINKDKQPDICATHYDPDCWMSTQKHISLGQIDEERLERRIKFDLENGLIPNDSILNYVVNKRNKMQRGPFESDEQLVVRLLKKDFGKNNVKNK